jgi:hypothetical protein
MNQDYWFVVTRSDEYRLQVSENEELRGMFRRMNEQITKGRTTLNNEELPNLHPSSNILGRLNQLYRRVLVCEQLCH